MGRDLTSLYISSSFQFLTQISGSELQDGLGNKITGSLAITASKADTATSASFATTASYVASVVSASYAVSSSFSNNSTSASYALVSTSSSFATNANSASYALNSTSASFANTSTSSSFASTATSASYALTASYAANANFDTGSLMKTGSVSLNTLTFTKGDGSTFNLTVDTGSAVTVNTGSLLVTASISNATTTFTKGDGSTFSITANNVVNANSASVATSASFATTAISASFATNATSASYSTNALSSSYAVSASQAQNAVSASYAPAGNPFPFTGSAAISGTLSISNDIWNWLFRPDNSGSMYIGPGIGTPVGNENIAIGSGSLAKTNINSYTNVAIGKGAGAELTTGQSNVFIGSGAGSTQVGGTLNVLIGGAVGGAGGTKTYNDTVAIGHGAYYNGSGNENIFIGRYPGQNQAGSENVVLGREALKNGNSQRNVVLGGYAGRQEVSGTANDNVILGYQAAYNLSQGDNNVLLGKDAGYNLSTGSNNVFIGYAAGKDEGGNNKLYIHNSSSASPLIYGEFDNRFAKINGDFNISGSYTGSLDIKQGSSSTPAVKISSSARDSYSTEWWAPDGTGTFLGIRDYGFQAQINCLRGSTALQLNSTADSAVTLNGRFTVGSSAGGFAEKVVSTVDVIVSGSLKLSGSLYDSNNSTGSSGQVLSSNASGRLEWTSAGGSINTGSFATTGSNTFIGNEIISGSLTVTGSSNFTGGDFKVTDQARNAEFDVDKVIIKTQGGTQFTGSVSSLNGFTGSLQGTASYASNALSSSYSNNSTSASYALNSTSASFASNVGTLTNLTVTDTGSFNGFVVLSQVSSSLNFADDTAAAAGGVPLGGLYRSGNFILIRLT